MTAYYNENDPKKAAWLRELIKRDLIALGEVDERSIEDVKPNDIMGFTQHHFFAGVGIWGYALRLAGWPDDRPVWTGSCPCPSFSAAGKGEGFEDARHLWPAWYRLISECGPATIFGEQVEAAIGYGWIDLVQTDLEAKAYAFGKIVLGACSVGAPHIRLRIYFVADSQVNRTSDDTKTRQSDAERSGDAFASSESLHAERWPLNEHGEDGRNGHDGGRTKAHGIAGTRGEVCERGDTQVNGREGQSLRTNREQTERAAEASQLGRNHDTIGNGRAEGRSDDESNERIVLDPAICTSNRIDANGPGSFAREQTSAIAGHRSPPESTSGFSDSVKSERAGLEGHFGDVRDWRGPGWLDPITARSVAAAGATRGFWADCDWWYGRDGKYRPIGPGLFPLAHGAPARVVRLRGYGDGIVAEVAKEFIQAYMSLPLYTGEARNDK